MASTTRRLLADGNSRRDVLNLFALTTPTLLAGFCSKELWKTLDLARIERNRQKAHGSLESDARDLEQLQRLELSSTITASHWRTRLRGPAIPSRPERFATRHLSLRGRH